MTPVHLAERRALYAAIDASGDRHIRPRAADPRVVHSPRSTVGVCDDQLWVRQHPGQCWAVMSIHASATSGVMRPAVQDDFGTLIEVARVGCGMAVQDDFGNLVKATR